MCDYSLHAVATRPAKAGDVLVVSAFSGTCTLGLAALHDRMTAVCMRPGTELAFERRPKARGWLWFLPQKIGSTVATFCQVDLDRPDRHHDAFTFSNGRVVKVNDLIPGQRLHVLQLPSQKMATPAHSTHAASAEPLRQQLSETTI